MGLFGNKSNKETPSDYHDLEPGAIPVATAVYDDELVHPAPPMPTAPVAPTAPPQQQQHVGHVVHVGISDPTMTRTPMMMRQCPNCQQESRTRIRTFPSWQTWLFSAVLLLLFWPICWIPLVVDACKQTEHFCVLCGAQVGKINAFQDCCVTNQS